ncbi:MAG TPA: NEW3 domain-containing protein, partial [Acetobacteraceae bacterium]|nr:NEW3 domain-containing protein [Acetobacteraceae bacterium]
AFSYEWLERAKGADRKYAGWPWYPALVDKYLSAGAHLLPVMGGSISFVPGRVGPDAAWRGEITDILRAFPQLKTWELSNEYDGQWTEPGRKEQATGWINFRAYHKAYGAVVAAVGGGELTAVENGRAGIYPELVDACVRGGDYADIQVVNCHHYCGVDAPELNIANQNTGGDQADPQLFHDRLRALVEAAHADGKQRPVWLTEFGWDTRVGKVVTPMQQAAYLQRGYLVAFHAGMDKAFWYWAIDGEQAKTFFDGCGLLDVHRQPKLGFAALAGIAGMMPNPHVLGTLEAGPGSFGFLVRQGEQRIAALWNLEREDGPEIEITSGRIVDFLGNPQPGRRARLGLAPVYVVGLDPNDRFARQGLWDLASPWLVHATAGDTVTMQVVTNGDGEHQVSSSVALEMPVGWSVHPLAPVVVKPADKARFELTVTIPATAAPGEQVLTVVASEGGKALKRMPVRVVVRAPLSIAAKRLSGEPGPSNLLVTVVNHAHRALAGSLHVQVPSGWQAPALDVPVTSL